MCVGSMGVDCYTDHRTTMKNFGIRVKCPAKLLIAVCCNYHSSLDLLSIISLADGSPET